MSGTHTRIDDFVAAVHTPFGKDGSFNGSVIAAQASHLMREGLRWVFVGGSTGECQSLTAEERRELAAAWAEACAGSEMRYVIHVGSNCLDEAVSLAGQAESLKAHAIAAFAPSYFKPDTMASLVDWCGTIADAAPGTPFYFYDIPSMTGVNLSMSAFLRTGADRMPTLAGLKYTNADQVMMQECLRLAEGRYEILWGMDEVLLGALALGVNGAVGSTYNMAGPIARRVWDYFEEGRMEDARREQYRLVTLVRACARHGYMASARAVMEKLGVPLGPPRPPFHPLSGAQEKALFCELEALGFLKG